VKARAFLRNFLNGVLAVIVMWTIALILILIVSWNMPPIGKMAEIAAVTAFAFGLLLAVIRHFKPAR
jgi:membrane associated rhomboid family serine protease